MSMVWPGVIGLNLPQRWAVLVWVLLAAGWLGLSLAAQLALRGQDHALARQSFGQGSRWQRLRHRLLELSGLLELSRAWDRRRGAAGHPHPVDRWLGTGDFLHGVGLAPLLVLGLLAATLAVAGILAQLRWWGWLLLALVPVALPIAATRLPGLFGDWLDGRDGRRRRRLGLARLAAVRDEAGRLRELCPATAAEWLRRADAVRDIALSDEPAFASRLRCLDRALLAAPPEFDVAAAEARERELCRRRLGLPAMGGPGELEVLLVSRDVGVDAEAQARLLASHLASPNLPDDARRQATPAVYRLLDRLEPRLDDAAAWRLWRQATALNGDREQRLRCRDRRRAAAAHRCASPQLAPVLWREVAFWDRAAVPQPRPPLIQAAGAEPLSGRCTWYREVASNRYPELPATLSAETVARRVEQLWRNGPSAAAESTVQRMVHAWAADESRRASDGVIELLPHIGEAGDRSRLGAAMLSGLAEAMGRYFGPAAEEKLELVDETIGLLDWRLAWRPRLASARSWLRYDPVRAERRLARLVDDLFAEPRSARIYEALLGAVETLALLPSPAADDRLADVLAALRERPTQGYLAVEECRATTLGHVPRPKWIEIATAAALARRGSGDGVAQLAAMLPPADALAEDAGAAAVGLTLAAAGCEPAWEAMAELLAQRLDEPVTGAPGGWGRRLLEQLAAGVSYREFVRLMRAAQAVTMEVEQDPR